MNNTPNIHPSNEIRAAWIRLEPHITPIERGREWAFEWIQLTCGIEAKRLTGRLRRYCKRNNLYLQSCADRFVVLDSTEHHRKLLQRKGNRDKATSLDLRQELAIDPGELPGEYDRQARDHLIRQLAEDRARGEEFHRRQKTILSTPAPTPRRLKGV